LRNIYFSKCENIVKCSFNKQIQTYQRNCFIRVQNNSGFKFINILIREWKK